MSAVNEITKRFKKQVIDLAQERIQQSGHKASKKSIKKIMSQCFSRGLVQDLVRECVRLSSENRQQGIEALEHEIQRIAKALAVQYLNSV